MTLTGTARDDDEELRPLIPKANQQDDEPFPFSSFTTLMAMRLAEPIAFTVIFPFINPMVAELKGSHSNVGFWAGLVESLFMATQCTTLLFWGRLSDAKGRKPILITGLIGSTLSIISFGLSRTFWWAVVARCLSGALNGNVAIVKSAVAELVPPRHHPIAFSCLSIIWGIGATIGPALGGFLSNPAKQYPQIFSVEGTLAFGGLWQDFPYLLPCAVAGSFSTTSVLIGLFLLPECLPRIVRERELREEQRRLMEVHNTSMRLSEADPTNHVGSLEARNGASRQCPPESPVVNIKRARDQDENEGSETRGDSRGGSSPRTSARRANRRKTNDGSISSLLKNPQVQTLLITQGFLSLVMVGIDAMQVLFFYEAIASGGLSLQPSQSGLVLALTGLLNGITQLCLFPILQRRLGTLHLYRLTLIVLPFSALMLPLANVVARGRKLEGGVSQDEWGVWTFVALSNTLKVFSSQGFASNMLLVNQSASLFTTVRLGALNALAQMASSGARAVGPLTFSSLLGITLERQTLHGYLAWLILAVVGCGGIIASMKLVDVEAMIRRGEVAERIEGRDD